MTPMNEPSQIELEQNVKTFIQLFQKGMECWVEAGKIVAALADADPEYIDRICEACSDFTPEFVRRFEQLGRRTLHPKLVWANGPGAKALRKLPYELQEKYVSESVELLVPSRSGNSAGWEPLRCDVLNLTKDQAAQVFDKDQVRSIAAQRAFLADREVKTGAIKATEVMLPYVIRRGKVIINAKCEFSRKDLARLMVELEED